MSVIGDRATVKQLKKAQGETNARLEAILAELRRISALLEAKA